MTNETFFIAFNENAPQICLQDSFRKFLKTRQGQLKPVKLHKKIRQNIPIKRIINDDKRDYLRHLFLQQAYEYIGVPYAKRYWTENDDEFYSTRFLDCCALVRRVMRDLQYEFGFRLGPWNQGYMHDLLPIEYTDIQDAKPGDLVFVEGVYYDEKKKPQKHDIMHVEILLGDGEKSLGARWNKGKVRVFDSYKFVSNNYEIKRFIFKSIDTWLQGICRSFCQEHNWHHVDHFYEPGKYSIFSSAEQNGEQEQDEACHLTELDLP